uniref:Ig-like domain-containing protein n=1 Tax=Mola mola TaxID=94237 RepID=A0A3Q3W6I9_MOLML
METRRVVLHFVLLLLATRTSDSASIERIFPVDGTIMLTPNPPVTEMITRIVWKHGVNLLAEGMDGKLYYFNRFTGRATLNITNGVLTVTNARLSDSASYEVEVNNKIQELRYDVKVIREVPKPSVSPKPLTCGPKSDRCDLTCEGDTSGAEPVSYSWMKGGVEWNQQAKKVEIKNTKDMAGVKTFSCEMKNNVSSEVVHVLQMALMLNTVALLLCSFHTAVH